MKREHFSSRLGFILITAACSIGLGSISIVVMEFAVGRASQHSTARSLCL